VIREPTAARKPLAPGRAALLDPGNRSTRRGSFTGFSCADRAAPVPAHGTGPRPAPRLEPAQKRPAVEYDRGLESAGGRVGMPFRGGGVTLSAVSREAATTPQFHPQHNDRHHGWKRENDLHTETRARNIRPSLRIVSTMRRARFVADSQPRHHGPRQVGRL
jgi:hypothetical protein